jgi:hypothetical protein
MKIKLMFKFLSVASVALLTLFAASSWPRVRGLHFGIPAKAAGYSESGEKLLQAATQEVDAQSEVTSCAYTFTSGSAETYLKYCVTTNGNIVSFQSPSGIEHIKSDTSSEGYGLCDGGAGLEYYDWAGAGASANWGKATLVTHTATEVKIERTTSDGVWTLTQTITQNMAGAYAKVEMQFKNNSAVAKGGFFMRWADVNADNSTINNLDSTALSAWGYREATNDIVFTPYGLLLQNLGVATISHSGYALNSNQPPDVCEPALNANGTLTATDGSIMMLYAFGGLGKNQTATVNVKYTAF